MSLDKQELLLLSLRKFYAIEGNKELILPIVKQKTNISLRLLDWLVTNYSKQYTVNYDIEIPGSDPSNPSGLGKENFCIWTDYKNQLKAYSKRQFDPFCRRNRIFYNCTDNTTTPIGKNNSNQFIDREDGFITTVGQLNFFRWALTYRVVDYAFNNITNIESDMLSSADIRKLREKGKRRKREMSLISNSVYKHDIKIIIQFP